MSNPKIMFHHTEVFIETLVKFVGITPAENRVKDIQSHVRLFNEYEREAQLLLSKSDSGYWYWRDFALAELDKLAALNKLQSFNMFETELLTQQILS